MTALDSLLVTEEETSGDHHDHDKFIRNGGRGMSAEQVEIGKILESQRGIGR